MGCWTNDTTLLEITIPVDSSQESDPSSPFPHPHRCVQFQFTALTQCYYTPAPAFAGSLIRCVSIFTFRAQSGVAPRFNCWNLLRLCSKEPWNTYILPNTGVYECTNMRGFSRGWFKWQATNHTLARGARGVVMNARNRGTTPREPRIWVGFSWGVGWSEPEGVAQRSSCVTPLGAVSLSHPPLTFRDDTSRHSRQTLLAKSHGIHHICRCYLLSVYEF